MEAVDPYKPLPPLKGQQLKFTSSQPFTPTFVKSHLPTQSASSLYDNRVKNKHILLENPLKESRRRKEKLKNRAAGRGRKGMKGVERKLVLNKDASKYELYEPLNTLWRGYISELLSLPLPPSPDAPNPNPPPIPNIAVIHAKLVKADYHGCIITVKRSKNPSLVGMSGIVIHETENTFKVITTNDRLKILPKAHSSFTFRIPVYAVPLQTQSKPSEDAAPTPQLEFELYGNQFCFRATDRATRKFKPKETIEL